MITQANDKPRHEAHTAMNLFLLPANFLILRIINTYARHPPGDAAYLGDDKARRAWLHDEFD